jgi:hypothetical protein
MRQFRPGLNQHTGGERYHLVGNEGRQGAQGDQRGQASGGDLRGRGDVELLQLLAGLAMGQILQPMSVKRTTKTKNQSERGGEKRTMRPWSVMRLSEEMSSDRRALAYWPM